MWEEEDFLERGFFEGGFFEGGFFEGGFFEGGCGGSHDRDMNRVYHRVII